MLDVTSAPSFRELCLARLSDHNWQEYDELSFTTRMIMAVIENPLPKSAKLTLESVVFPAECEYHIRTSGLSVVM